MEHVPRPTAGGDQHQRQRGHGSGPAARAPPAEPQRHPPVGACRATYRLTTVPAEALDEKLAGPHTTSVWRQCQAPPGPAGFVSGSPRLAGWLVASVPLAVRRLSWDLP